MKQVYILSVLYCFLLSNALSAQRMETLIDKVTVAELEISEYPDDPLAEAYVIFDTGNTRFVNFDDGLRIHHVRTAKIKILNNDGLGQAEISIPLYQDSKRVRENLISVEAYGYNLVDGKVEKTTFNEKEVFEEKGLRRKF